MKISIFFMIGSLVSVSCQMRASYFARSIMHHSKAGILPATRVLPNILISKFGRRSTHASKSVPANKMNKALIQTFFNELETSCKNKHIDRRTPTYCLETCHCKPHEMVDRNPLLLEARGKEQNTPLLFAAKLQRDWLVNALLKKNVDIEARDSNGDRALKVALIKCLDAMDNGYSTTDRYKAEHIALLLAQATLRSGKKLVSPHHVLSRIKLKNLTSHDARKEVNAIYDEAKK